MQKVKTSTYKGIWDKALLQVFGSAIGRIDSRSWTGPNSASGCLNIRCPLPLPYTPHSAAMAIGLVWEVIKVVQPTASTRLPSSHRRLQRLATKGWTKNSDMQDARGTLNPRKHFHPSSSHRFPWCCLDLSRSIGCKRDKFGRYRHCPWLCGNNSHKAKAEVKPWRHFTAESDGPVMATNLYKAHPKHP